MISAGCIMPIGKRGLEKKMFSWALSDLGKIWEELLTDQNGQYVELQSGRLFNQNMVSSSLTPLSRFISTLSDRCMDGVLVPY